MRDRLIKLLRQLGEDNSLSDHDNALKAAMKRLTFREREIMKLRFGIGEDIDYSVSEIAHIFNVSRGRINTILNRGLMRLSEDNDLQYLKS